MNIIIRTPDNKEDILIEEINECPMCHKAIKPQVLYSCRFNERNVIDSTESTCSVLNLCTACNHTFLVEYTVSDEVTSSDDAEYEFTRIDYVCPKQYADKVFDPHINKISPSFVSIYNQALAAESMGLNDISGIAYRKAVEFLVKDYAIFKNPMEKSKIESETLGNCIDKYVSDSTVTALAKSATWLGNDHTHYVQKHPTKSIAHLKMFIDSLQYFICMHEIAQEAAAFTK